LFSGRQPNVPAFGFFRAPDAGEFGLAVSFVLPRWSLKALLLALPVLVVAFGVVLGASQLAAGMGDASGARWLLWWAIAALILLVIDGILLLALLGLRAAAEDDRQAR